MASFLVHGTPWLLWGLYAAWLLALALAAPIWICLLRRALPPRALPAAALIALGACALRLAAVPRHLVYNDELEHADIAANLAERRAFAETWAGGLPEWSVLAPPIWPGGFHTLLAPLVPLAARPEDAAFRLNAVLGSLTAGLAALAAALLFRDLLAGLGAGLLLALWPLHRVLSAAGGLEPNSCLWLALLVLALWAWRQEPHRGTELLALATAALAAHARLENAVLVALLLAVAAPPSLPPWRRFWPARLLFLLATAAVLPVLLVSMGLQRPGYAVETLRPLAQLCENLPGSLRFFLDYDSRLLPLAVLAALGALGAPKPWGRVLLGWPLGLFLFYNTYALGDLSRGDSWRYAAAVGLPLAMLAGAAFSYLWTRSRLFVAAMFAFCVFPAADLTGPDPRFEASWRLVREKASALPHGVPVISFSPSLIRAAARHPAVSVSLLLEPQPRAKELWAVLDKRGAVLLEDEWFRRKPEQARALKELLDGRFTAETLAEVPGARLSRLTPRGPRGRLSTAGPRLSPRRSR